MVTMPRPGSTVFPVLPEGRTEGLGASGGRPGRLHPCYIWACRNLGRAAVKTHKYEKQTKPTLGGHVKQKATKQIKTDE